MSWAARNLAAYLQSGPGTTEITPDTGALSLTGKQPSVRPITPSTGTLTLTGKTATANRSNYITPSTGSLTLTGKPTSSASQSQIISREYTGTGGTSPRSFSSDGFVPLFVVVIGKDGSGNVVGACKSIAMPSGKSQPFVGNAAASDAARSNRILSIDANGFTVGPDLNVNGRSYAYIMFPAGRFGAVTAGYFTGAATTSPGAGVLGVSASQIDGQGPGSTNFVTQANCERRWYRPAGSTVYTPGTPLILAGRRMIRNSDGAVLAECAVGGFINTSSCLGTGYILGNEGAYHWEEQYIELHTLVPDMMLLMADDATGVFVPATFAPPPNVPATNHSWDGSGGGSLFAYFVSNTESVLHIFDTNGTAYNAKDVLYHWLALKGDEAGSGGVRIKTFTYTGTGDAGPVPTLTGAGFDPEWAFIESAPDQFHWSKRAGSGILGTNVSRRWIDGTGDQILVNPAYTMTFVTDGVTIPATNSAYNVLGRTYTVTLIGVASPAENTLITPNTGSLICTLQHPTVAQTRKITPAATSLSLTGQAASLLAAGRITPQTGTLTLTGRQPVLKTRITPDTGALALIGQQCVKSPPTSQRRPNTGSLTLTGQQPKQRITITPSTGALALTGQACLPNTSFPSIRTPGTGSLGLTTYGLVIKTSLTPRTGELQLQTFNTQPIVRSNNLSITPLRGTLNFLGYQPTVLVSGGVVAITPNAGALTLSGQAVTLRTRTSITPNTGSLIFTGQTPVVRSQTRVTPNTGALVLTGQIPVVRREARITPNTGTLVFTGQTPVLRAAIRITPNTGALVLTGQTPTVRSQTRITPNTGSLILTGQPAAVTRSATITPNAGILVLTGQQPILRTAIRITPNTGALVLTGRPVVAQQSVPTITPNTGSLSLTGQPVVVRRDSAITPNTGSLVFNGQAASTKGAGSITPQTGSLVLQGRPAVIDTGASASITPGTGTLTLVGQQPVQRLSLFPNTGQLTSEGQEPDEETEFFNVPFAGALTLTGYQPIVQVKVPGSTITPGTGSLNLVGKRCIVRQPRPPIPPTPGPIDGGVGLPTPRKLPFWPKTIITARGRIVAPAPTLRGRASVEESELAIFLE